VPVLWDKGWSFSDAVPDHLHGFHQCGLRSHCPQ